MLNRRIASGVATTAAVAALLFATSAAEGQRPLVVGISAGLSIPTSDLSNTHSTGWNAALGLDYQFPATNAGVRFEGFYNSFGGKGNRDNATIAGGGVNLFYNLGGVAIRPYVIGGVGAYNVKNFPGNNDSETELGINAGVGLKMPLGTLNTFLEARLHSVTGDPQSQFVPIVFGIQF